MKGKLLICGVVTGVITLVCGLVFGLAQPEKPFEVTSMTWAQLVALVEKNKGTDIDMITLETAPWATSLYPRLEVQFRQPRLKAIISVDELKRRNGTRCGTLGWPSNDIFSRIDWITGQALNNRITYRQKIVAPVYKEGHDKSCYQYVVKDGKPTGFSIVRIE